MICKTIRRFGCALALAWAVPALALGFAIPPAPVHHVTDNAGVLNDATRAQLESELQSYETTTGHQVVVWIGETTGGVPLETWTAETAHAWKIGRKGYDDGVVLFVFMQDHTDRVEVGYGLESVLTDAAAKSANDNAITPNMRAGKPDRAIVEGVNAMLAAITPSFQSGVASPPPAGEKFSPPPLSSILFPVLLLFIASIAAMLILRRIGSAGAAPRGASLAGATVIGSSGGSSSSDDSFSSSSDDFDAGGGDFGGGGASGSW